MGTELVAAGGALPEGAFGGDDAAAEGDFAAFGLFKSGGVGFAVNNVNEFAAAVGAFAGLSGNFIDGWMGCSGFVRGLAGAFEVVVVAAEEVIGDLVGMGEEGVTGTIAEDEVVAFAFVVLHYRVVVVDAVNPVVAYPKTETEVLPGTKIAFAVGDDVLDLVEAEHFVQDAVGFPDGFGQRGVQVVAGGKGCGWKGRAKGIGLCDGEGILLEKVNDLVIRHSDGEIPLSHATVPVEVEILAVGAGFLVVCPDVGFKFLCQFAHGRGIFRKVNPIIVNS